MGHILHAGTGVQVYFMTLTAYGDVTGYSKKLHRFAWGRRDISGIRVTLWGSFFRGILFWGSLFRAIIFWEGLRQ
jgi:hypothetical protein